MFKDHLIDWVTKYICQKSPGASGKAILDDINWQYGSFCANHKDAHHSFQSCSDSTICQSVKVSQRLRLQAMDRGWFKGPHEGMRRTTLHYWSLSPHLITEQVYLPAIKGHVPDKIVYTIWSFLEFCYCYHQDGNPAVSAGRSTVSDLNAQVGCLEASRRMEGKNS